MPLAVQTFLGLFVVGFALSIAAHYGQVRRSLLIGLASACLGTGVVYLVPKEHLDLAGRLGMLTLLGAVALSAFIRARALGFFRSPEPPQDLER